MKDRYLYRAKQKGNEEWITGSLITCEDGTCKIAIRYLDDSANIAILICVYDVVRDTICQCTGLKDKNGKLIWENDILDGFTYPYMSDGIHNYYVEVCWCDNVPSFGIYTQKYPESKVAGISAGMTELMEDWNPNDWEVIGNIFDNKELLESEG